MTIHQPITAAEQPRKFRLLAEHYLLLAEHGSFSDYAKSELIDGTIYVVNAQFSRHSRIQTTLLLRFAHWAEQRADGTSAIVELSIDLRSGYMPRPDIVVAKELPDDGPALPEHLLLVVEVCNSTRDMDARQKPASYAAGGVAEYWLVDVAGDRLIQHWDAADGLYRERREVAFGDPVQAATTPSLLISTDGLT